MKKFLRIFGPGLLIAATGVGAGDLATSALAGSRVGVSVVSAVIIGGLFKYVLNEGLARWQFDTGTTLIEGAMRYYGRFAQYLFLCYLLVWSFTVAVALMSASGIAFYALFPLFEEAVTGKIVYGIGLSILGAVLVLAGGFRLFERIMSLSIVLMLITVIITVFQLNITFELSAFLPSEEFFQGGFSLEWFIAVLGGVGGTVTVLCYGYWIREHQRTGRRGLAICRVDLALAYAVTVLLGICMVLIGSQIKVEGGGASLLIQLSQILESESGELAGWLFRIGAFAAIYSSLLGVWQSVPYLFTDLRQLMKQVEKPEVNTHSRSYKWFLLGLASVPMLGLPFGFASMQKLYALCGAAFIPILALTLILLHFQPADVRKHYRNGPLITALYAFIFLFFLVLAIRVVV